MATPSHIFFDVNETLTDFSPVLDAARAALGGGEGQGRRWFNALIEYSLAETLSGIDRGFLDIGAATLAMLVAEDGGRLDVATAHDALADAIGTVTLRPDVEPGMARLAAQGHTLATLTNSDEQSQRDTLTRLGVDGYLTDMIGVQSTGGYKPDPRTFALGLSRLGVSAEDSLMVACHPWDLIGARAVGMRIAFVRRPGTAWYPAADAPDHTVESLTELADELERTADAGSDETTDDSI